MKNLLMIIPLFISLNLFAENELKWVDEQIQAIKPPRSGISKSSVNATENPFIFLNKIKSKEKRKTTYTRKVNKVQNKSNSVQIYKKNITLRLSAIMNNSALINGRWYKIKDKVGQYTLMEITRKNVLLTYKAKKLLLSTNSKNRSLKFKNN